jgi:hypothetical protein
MAFTRVNPGGFSIGAQLTSAQMNNLDADHANALDKTVAGDTLSGVVAMAATAAINVNHAGAAIVSSVASGIQSTANQAILINAAGALTLAGSPTPYFPAFASGAINRTIVSPLDSVTLVSAAPLAQGTINSVDFVLSTSNGPFVSGVAQQGVMKTQVVNTANSNVWAYYLPLRQLHQGATLSSVAIWLQGVSTHSALPAVMPSLGIFRQQTSSPGASAASLNSGAQFIADPTVVLATYKSWHSWSFTCNQNNVIDVTQYQYFAVVWDEGFTNAQANNLYSGLILSYSSIADMRFP